MQTADAIMNNELWGPRYKKKVLGPLKKKNFIEILTFYY